MGSTEVIVVGVDGSTESIAAVTWASHRSVRTGARIHCVCTYALASYSAAALDGGYAVLDDEALQKGAQQVVDEAVAHATKHGAKNAGGSIQPGDPAGVLIDFSKEADLVVVGSRGSGGFADRLLGTVSSALPAHAKCPVVVVPRHTSGKKFTPVERIVVGIDGTEAPSSALRRSVEEAQTWGARLTAISAVPIAVGPAVMAWTPTGIDHSALLAQVREGMDKAIAEAVGDRGINVARHARGPGGGGDPRPRRTGGGAHGLHRADRPGALHLPGDGGALHPLGQGRADPPLLGAPLTGPAPRAVRRTGRRAGRRAHRTGRCAHGPVSLLQWAGRRCLRALVAQGIEHRSPKAGV